MYGGLSTAVKLYRYLAEYLEMDMRIIMTAESIKSEIMEQYPDFVCMESGQDSDAHKTVCTVDVCNHSRGNISVRKKGYIHGHLLEYFLYNCRCSKISKREVWY